MGRWVDGAPDEGNLGSSGPGATPNFQAEEAKVSVPGATQTNPYVPETDLLLLGLIPLSS